MTSTLDLEAEARRLTRALGGVWHGSTGMACCPAHDDNTPSLSISAGRKTILLHCFAGCDFIDVIRAVRSECRLHEGRLPATRSERQPRAKDFAPLARKLWAEARDLRGTLGEQYMVGRGLVAPWPELRFHPCTPFGAGALAIYRPAIIAAVRDNSGLVAIHRIAIDARTTSKATDLPNPKLTLGRPKRGAVRLFRASRTLGIAEGVETAKSAARMLGIPVWAVLGNERFPLIDIPFDVTRLILLPDRGVAGDRAALLGHEAHAQPGRTVEDIPPPDDFDDWNEADQARQRILQQV
jgi:hypothetical protein